MKERLLDGDMRISCVHGRDERYIEIRIEDELSGMQFLEARLTLEQYGELVGANSSVPVKFEVRGLDKVGKKMESKIVPITFPKGTLWRNRNLEPLPAFDEAVKPFEIEGWQAVRYTSSKHGTNAQGEDVYQVTFRRWLEIEDVPESHEP